MPLDEIAAAPGSALARCTGTSRPRRRCSRRSPPPGSTTLSTTRARRAADADPGAAFFGFLAGSADEAVAKRDLPDAIAIAGPLQDALHAALGALLRRAQQAGAVRADITVPDILMLLKGLLRSIKTCPPARRARPWLTGCSPSWLTDYGHIPDPAPSPQMPPGPAARRTFSFPGATVGGTRSGTATQNGGSRVATVTSDRHAARLTFQSEAILNAESARSTAAW